MNELLQVAVNAHGGPERWNQLKTVKASVSITGAIWQLKASLTSSKTSVSKPNCTRNY
jgi:hypothetical protein